MPLALQIPVEGSREGAHGSDPSPRASRRGRHVDEEARGGERADLAEDIDRERPHRPAQVEDEPLVVPE